MVLDTSTLMAGLLARRGAAHELVERFFAGQLELHYTPAILAEYAEVMARPKFLLESNEQIAVLLKLRSSARLVRPVPLPAQGWPDPDDIPFVAAALATEEKIVVTLNASDFGPARALGVRVLTPTEAVIVLRRR